MTVKKKKLSPKIEMKTVGFQVKEIEYFWLCHQANLRGRTIEDMSKEGLSIVRSLDEDLLQLGWLESARKRVFFGDLLSNALRVALKLPTKRLRKAEKVEMETPISKQIEELRVKMRRRKPVKQSGHARVVSDAGKILDSKAHIEKIIKKKIEAGDK